MLLFHNILRLHTAKEIETMPDQSRKPSTANATEPLLTPKDLAGRLKITVETLCRWRARGVGPRYHRFDRAIRYTQRDVDAWLASQQAA